MNSGTPDAPPPMDDPPPAGPARRHRWGMWLLIVATLAVAAYLLLPGTSRAQRKKSGSAAGAQNQPVPVVTAAARIGDVGVYLNGLGNVTALNTAVVKSRVDGQLMRIDFHEGQLIREGELLAELDPRPFQVQLMQAQGQKAKDEAALENAKVDLRRYQILMQQDSIPKQQLDTQAATVRQFEAAVLSDQAQVESAKLNLVYCKVTAPIGGRVGLRLVDTGNIVHAGDANGIVVVNQVQPITVIFTIPADRLPQVVQQMHAGRQLTVDAFDRDNQNRLASGALAAVDNQIDQTTGTVRLRAVFPNTDDALFPSQFINARLLVSTLHGAVLVPTAAIQRSPQATFVYSVNATNHTVVNRNVEVQLTEGDTTAISHGLAPGERVVVDGVDRLHPGSLIAETPVEATTRQGRASTPGGGSTGDAAQGGSAAQGGTVQNGAGRRQHGARQRSAE
jgi:membrane fusion protein, multidrug efflux system